MEDYLNNIDEFDAEYKVVLAGNSDIGKTTFFKKITKGTFSEIYVSTIGYDKKSFEYDITITENGQDVKKKVKILLYDTAGQERYAPVTKNYFKKASGIILLYSIIDRKSFENLTKWLNDIRDKLGNYEDNKYLVFLMGTKFDIAKNDESKRQVKEEEALEFCDNNDLLWYGEYSSKDTSQDTFQKLLAEFAKKLYIKVGFNKLQRDSVSTLSTKKTKKHKKKCKC